MNSFFNKPASKKWTWRSPDGQSKNEIDFIISNKKQLISDVEVDERIDIGSDHRAVRARLTIIGKSKKRRKYQAKQVNKAAKLVTEQYEQNLMETLKGNIMEIETNVDKFEEKLRMAVIKTSDKLYKSQLVNKTQKREIPNDIKRMMAKRRRLKKNKHKRAEYKELSITIRRKLKNWSECKKVEEIKHIIESGSSFKKYWRSQIVGKKNIVKIKDSEGKLVSDKGEIANAIAKFYKELYKEDKEENAHGNRYVDICWNKDEVPEIMLDEVVWGVNKQKNGRVGGKDRMIAEELKAGGKVMATHLMRLFNLCLESGEIPSTWLRAQLILLHKKGDILDLNNYRPLSLLPIMSKVFMSVITRRIGRMLDENIDVSQTGFRRNMATVDHIFVIKQLIRKARDYNFPLVLTFIDFKKAFDSVYRENIIEAMCNSGIEEKYIKLFNYIYCGAKMEIAVRGEERCIGVKRGVRQGDVPSGKIFIKVLEGALRTLNWEGLGINVHGEWLNMLKFVDDIVIISTSYDEAKNMLTEIQVAGREVGLMINEAKTKVISWNIDSEDKKYIEVENMKFEVVNKFIYLGSLICDERCHKDSEVSRRIVLGWRAFNKFRNIFVSDLSIDMKKKLWTACIKPVMTYGAEAWTLNENTIKQMRVAQRQMERCMLKISRKDRMRNRWLREQTGLEDVGNAILERKWSWAGHIVRTCDGRWTKKMISWYPRDCVRKRGRPSIHWDEEMRRSCGGVTWMRVAEDRAEWCRMKEVYSKVWLYKN